MLGLLNLHVLNSHDLHPLNVAEFNILDCVECMRCLLLLGLLMFAVSVRPPVCLSRGSIMCDADFAKLSFCLILFSQSSLHFFTTSVICKFI